MDAFRIVLIVFGLLLIVTLAFITWVAVGVIRGRRRVRAARINPDRVHATLSYRISGDTSSGTDSQR